MFAPSIPRPMPYRRAFLYAQELSKRRERSEFSTQRQMEWAELQIQRGCALVMSGSNLKLCETLSAYCALTSQEILFPRPLLVPPPIEEKKMKPLRFQHAQTLLLILSRMSSASSGQIVYADSAYMPLEVALVVMRSNLLYRLSFWSANLSISRLSRWMKRERLSKPLLFSSKKARLPVGQDESILCYWRSLDQKR